MTSLTLMDRMLTSFWPETKLNGLLTVEKLSEKCAVTRCFSTYPLQILIPRKALHPTVDAVVAYLLTFGGGLVSGDCIHVELNLGANSTTTVLTQGFTNVYKSVEGKTTRQILKCSVGSGGLLALLPDSVVCFADAKYSQVQSFNLAIDGNLVLVDWLTSGRVARGECWSFEHFRSTNHVYIEGNVPLLLDSLCIEQGGSSTIADRMGEYHVIGMIFVYGPRLTELRQKLQMNVESYATEHFRKVPQRLGQKSSTSSLFASCSSVGPQDDGLLIRIAATTTNLMFQFLKEQLAPLECSTGIFPYKDNS